jgi:hypothetical protein
LTIEKVLRVGRELNPIFEATKFNPEAMYLPAQVTECLDAYVAANKLNGDKDSILPNKELGDALYKVLCPSYPLLAHFLPTQQ